MKKLTYERKIQDDGHGILFLRIPATIRDLLELKKGQKVEITLNINTETIEIKKVKQD